MRPCIRRGSRSFFAGHGLCEQEQRPCPTCNDVSDCARHADTTRETIEQQRSGRQLRLHSRRPADTIKEANVRTHGPPRLVGAREGGADVLAAGARGFVLVDLETEKARVFGDVSQEKAFVAVAAAWVGDVVAVVVKAAPRGGARGGTR